MSHDLANSRPQGWLGRRLFRLFGLEPRDKQGLSLCRDRMAALDDPRTRRAIADLPSHLLRDIGVVELRPGDTAVEGEALRRHLW
ncbi:hypothetical protein [Paracoccus sp. DMF]|uniref:hypothetical protein n=1 Tax=Paracoccus sp. DMF TaxID=400837 RepID=UPI0011018B94|nr:hypothetical protein [Paracoccus sp. DMF]MCV2447794.1 hypothetical protein [Paracoccus sp. DMF]